MVALMLFSWMPYARIVNSTVGQLKSVDYVVAAQAMGAGSCYQLGMHVVPNLLPLLSTSFALVCVWSVKAV